MNPHAISFTNKKVSVYGLGVEGQSIVQFLLREKASSIRVYEEVGNQEDLNERINAFHADTITGSVGPFVLDDCDVVFRSPGMRPDLSVFQTAREKGVLVTSSSNVFFARCPCPIIGVTGTKGKGTTSALITEMLKEEGREAFLGGNIGVPPLDFLDKLRSTSWVVLELSSFQLWDLDASPHIGVTVMVTVDHLDLHTSETEYLEAKSILYKYQNPSIDLAVVNWDHSNSQAVSVASEAPLYKTSVIHTQSVGSYLRANNLVFCDGTKEETVAKVSDIALPGPHNIQNALSALTAAKLADVSNTSIVRALQTFKGLPHRLEFVEEINGVSYYDDSFSTTPETAIAAIQSFSQPKVLILGGSTKNSDFSQLGEIINQSTSIKSIVGIGQEWARIKHHIVRQDIRVIEGCTTMKDIIQEIQKIVQPGDVVLLSPGCASFGLFLNYKERGNHFKQEVRKIKKL